MVLFRCSSLGHLMVEPKAKNTKVYLKHGFEISAQKFYKYLDAKDFDGLSVSTETEKGDLAEGVITHLIDKYVSQEYGRESDVFNRYIAKGLMVEEASITLYTLATGKMFIKNETRLSNEYINGTPDLYIGSSIDKAEVIIDIKSSYDIFTFYRAKYGKLNKVYYWQLQGYMALTGAKKARLVYCLVDTPDSIVEGSKFALARQMNLIDPHTDNNYLEAAEKLEKLAKYDDIDIKERIHEIEIDRNDDDIQRLYTRIQQCLEYMNTHLFKTTNPELLNS